MSTHDPAVIDNIKRNRKIREGLFADLNEQQASDWLHLL